MTDMTGTGDTHGIVASILAKHHAHHGGTAHTHSSAIPSRCHATHAEMIGAPSATVEQTLRRIIDNGHIGTPEEAQWAKWWLERNSAAAISEPAVSPLL